MTKPKAHKTPRAPTSTSWRAGQPSPNPAGRPRSGLAFAERIRERISPDVVIDLVERHLADEDVPIAARLATVLPYVHAGFAKPATTTNLDVSTTRTIERDWTSVPVAERRALLSRLRAVPAVEGDGRDTKPPLTNTATVDVADVGSEHSSDEADHV